MNCSNIEYIITITPDINFTNILIISAEIIILLIFIVNLIHPMTITVNNIKFYQHYHQDVYFINILLLTIQRYSINTIISSPEGHLMVIIKLFSIYMLSTFL